MRDASPARFGEQQRNVMQSRYNSNPQNKQVMNGRKLSPLVRWWKEQRPYEGQHRKPRPAYLRVPSNDELLRGAA